MRSGNRKIKSKGAAIFLTVVFSFLQLALWCPTLLSALPAKELAAACQHDHIHCGCSPSRIASGTCCCALASISPCCQKNYVESAMAGNADLGTVITSLPCGGSADPLVTASIESYLLPGTSLDASPVSATVYPLAAVINQRDCNIPPPIPPPQA